MKKQILKLVGLMSIFAVHATFAWDFSIMNDTTQGTGVHAYFATAFCSDDHFHLNPGETKTINAGICDLTRVKLDSGAEYTGANPISGLKILTNQFGKQVIVTK